MKERRPECIIFDMDGVLVNTAAFHLEAWDIFGKRRGKPATSEFFYSHFGMKNSEIFPDLFGPITPEENKKLSDEKESIFRDCIRGRVRALAGVVELIADAHRSGLRIAVGSSAPRENVHLIVEEIGIMPMLSGVITGDDVEFGKPDPAIFLSACRACKANARDCLVFEDAPVGVQAAKAAQMACVAITTTTTPENLSRADLVIQKFSDINVKKVLEQISMNRSK